MLQTSAAVSWTEERALTLSVKIISGVSVLPCVTNVCKTYLFPNSQNSSRFQGVNWDPPKHVRFTPDKYDPPFPWSCDVSSLNYKGLRIFFFSKLTFIFCPANIFPGPSSARCFHRAWAEVKQPYTRGCRGRHPSFLRSPRF